MATHLIGSQPCSVVRLASIPLFSVENEVRATRTISHRDGSFGDRFVCQKGGPARTCDDCMACTRFVALSADAPADPPLVRCRWSARDPVSARMTTLAALVWVTPETACLDALVLARCRGLHHLPVLADAGLVGVVCVCDLEAPMDAQVGQRMSKELLALDESARLGEAAAAMKTFKVGCLPVLASGSLVGMITVGDLSHIGVPDDVLGLARCADCGGAHCVRTTVRAPGAALCVDCMRRKAEALAELELGEPD